MKAFVRDAILLAFAALLLALGFSILLKPAHAGGRAICGPYAQITAQLTARYGETLAFTGVLPTGAVAELTVNPDGKTWTMLFRDPDSNACIVLAGPDWTGGPAPLVPGVEG